MTFIRAFSSSRSSFQATNHRLYAKIDWTRIEGGDYAVVNPADPAEILYLSERDYIVQLRVSMTQNHRLIVLATPQSPSPTSSSSDFKKSPPEGETPKQRKLLGGVFKKMFGTSFSWVKKVLRKEGQKPTLENMVVVTDRNILPLIDTWSYQLWSRIEGLKSSRVFRRDVWTFVDHLVVLLKTRGMSHLILRLKIYLFVISTFISGTTLRDTSNLGCRVKLANGLPKCLPLSTRVKLRQRHIPTIRLWSSIFYMYKAMSGPHKEPRFGVISSSVPEREVQYIAEFELWKEFAPKFYAWLVKTCGAKLFEKIDLVPTSFFSAGSAGPNYKWSVGSLPLDTLYWVSIGWKSGSPLWDLMNAVKDVAGINMFKTCAMNLISSFYESEHRMSISKALAEGSPIPPESLAKKASAKLVPPHLLKDGQLPTPLGGRLAALPEAAGKVRIIAIVDSWSQTYLTPIHDFLFKILRKVPCDATFDQQGAVSSFAEKGLKNLYSYDLSQATDTIPWTLYQVLMEPVFGKEITSAWMAVLRDRDWLLPLWSETESGEPKRLEHQGKSTVRYNRGQPMGARSSWPALALVHHGLVQFAAHKVSKFPFGDYLVLGDDLVIGDHEVAISYRKSATPLGVRIGLPKSFVSTKGFFNFANQSFLDEINLSPISFKEELATKSVTQRSETLWKAVDKGFLDISKADFFSKAIRWYLKPDVAKRVERDRKRGELNSAARHVASSIFLSALEGVKAFSALRGLSIKGIVSGMVNPGLSLFTFGLAPDVVTKESPKWVWASKEFSLLLIDRLSADLRKKFILRSNALRALLRIEKVETAMPLPVPDPALVRSAVSDNPGRSQGRWRTLGREIFGKVPQLTSTVTLWDGTKVPLAPSKDALEMFSSELIVDLAKRILPLHNFTLSQIYAREQKARTFVENFPDALLELIPRELEMIKQLDARLTQDLHVGQEEEFPTRTAPVDVKVMEVLLLSDLVRSQALEGKKTHTKVENP